METKPKADDRQTARFNESQFTRASDPHPDASQRFGRVSEVATPEAEQEVNP
jgi:hypothetical protein